MITAENPCWVALTDRLPREISNYRVYFDGADSPTLMYFDGTEFYSHNTNEIPTHWASIPDPRSYERKSVKVTLHD
tara:strand:+ start:743 stop:970 length:228 start_codon:yes stop_codon:yes gene_type:complete